MKKNGFTLIELMIIIAIIGILAAVAIGGFGTNAEGTRSGLIVKLSHKGLFWKTWEGELMLGSGNSGQSWDFSIRKNNPNERILSDQLERAEQDRKVVSIKYKQAIVVMPWNADTTYDVVEIK